MDDDDIEDDKDIYSADNINETVRASIFDISSHDALQNVFNIYVDKLNIKLKI